jgi:nitrate reductase gamma subunit
MSATLKHHRAPSFGARLGRLVLIAVIGLVLTHILGIAAPIFLMAQTGVEIASNVGHAIPAVIAAVQSVVG